MQQNVQLQNVDGTKRRGYQMSNDTKHKMSQNVEITKRRNYKMSKVQNLKFFKMLNG